MKGTNAMFRRATVFCVAAIAVLAMGGTANAAVVTWGLWSADIVDNTAIQAPSGYTIGGGVNFNGSTTTINNGAVDVVFTGIAWKGSGSAAGITVGNSGFGFQSTGNNSNVSSSVGSPQNWGTVLDRVIGGAGGQITLTGLTEGTGYYVQFFSNAPDANIQINTKITSGGVDSPFFGSHAGGRTRYIFATFTADATGTQAFTVAGTEPTFSALTVGVPEPATMGLLALGGLAVIRRRKNA